MASTNSTVDGMGFEEMNQPGSQTANIWLSGSITAEGNIKATGSMVGSAFNDNKGRLHSVGLDQGASAAYGYRVQAGSTQTANSNSGLVVFSTPFANKDWVMTISVANMSNPYKAIADGSGATPMVSGARRASGCWLVAGSQTKLDWIAVGI